VKEGSRGKGLLFRYYDLAKHPMNINLIDGLQLGVDFIIINEQIWDFLYKIYKEGLAIKRYSFMAAKDKKIEFYPKKVIFIIIILMNIF
jgi:hypothetical protein